MTKKGGFMELVKRKVRGKFESAKKCEKIQKKCKKNTTKCKRVRLHGV
jgi:hypothetical protein